MQCFICVMYMMFLCGASPPRRLEPLLHPRSLFRDVIESLRIRSQMPDDINQNDENNLSQNFATYEHEPRLPSDAEFIPRRNDRIEMPSLKYRFPKSLDKNFTVDIETTEAPKEEIILYIDTNKDKSTTIKPKKPQKRRPIKNKDDETSTDEMIPVTNTMAGQSQIGNRESQIVVKPTVIVNFRGTVRHKDSEIKLEGRKSDENGTVIEPPQNIFNINQEIKLERTFSGMDTKVPKIEAKRDEMKLESKMDGDDKDLVMLDSATWGTKTDRDGRKVSSIFQILFSI